MKYLLSLVLVCLGVIQGVAQVPDTLQNLLDTTLERNLSQYRNLFEETVSKTVIKAEDIYLRGYDNLDELLASVEGVYISHDRTFTQIAMRGISPTPDNNQRVLVLLDDVPLNNPMTGYAASGYDLRGINMEDIEEVVIIRGASPVSYGNNALTGVIKIKTKTEEKGFRLNFDAGSYGELDGGFSAGYNIGKAKFGLSGRFSQFAGQELYIPGDSIPDQEAYDFGGLQFKFNFEGLSLNATYLQRNELMPGLPSESYIALVAPSFDLLSTSYFHRNQTDDPGDCKEQNLFIDLGFAKALNSMHAIDACLFVNYQFNGQELFFHEIETIDTPYIAPNSAYVDYQVDQEEKSLWAGASYQHYLYFSENHQFNAGLQFVGLLNAQFGQDATILRHYDGYDLYTSPPFDSTVHLFIDSFIRKPFENYQEQFPFWRFAFNIQDKYRINDYFAIQAGLRVELSSITGIQLAPMGQIQITPWLDKTNISLGYNQGYRLPTILETSVTQSKQSFPNPDLAAEKIHNELI